MGKGMLLNGFFYVLQSNDISYCLRSNDSFYSWYGWYTLIKHDSILDIVGFRNLNTYILRCIFCKEINTSQPMWTDCNCYVRVCHFSNENHLVYKSAKPLILSLHVTLIQIAAACWLILCFVYKLLHACSYFCQKSDGCPVW